MKDGLIYWLGTKVHPCRKCGVPATNVDDCGEFGNPDCPRFGVGRDGSKRVKAGAVFEVSEDIPTEFTEEGYEELEYTEVGVATGQQERVMNSMPDCPHCGNELQLDDAVEANVRTYQQGRTARTLCCGRGVYVAPVFTIRAVKTPKGWKEDDWGNRIKVDP